MGRYSNSILYGFSMNSPLQFLVFSYFLLLGHFSFYCSYADSPSPLFNSYTISSLSYPRTKLRPFEWRYIRVEIPESFSSVSIELDSDVDFDPSHVSKISKSTLPLICLRYGSIPLPDYSDSSLRNLVLESFSNKSLGGTRGLRNGEHCYPMQKRIELMLTIEQISHGVWYLGLFNGLGAVRTESKMINRGDAYSFSANVSVGGCTSPNFWGQYCNQTVESLSCSQSFINTLSESRLAANLVNQTAELIVPCRSSTEEICLEENEQKFYSIGTVGPAEQLIIQAVGLRLNGTSSSNETSNRRELELMCYARYGAMPSPLQHDYAADLNKGPLIIQSPKAGSWYVSVAPGNGTRSARKALGSGRRICYSLDWQVAECPMGKAGFNCSSERYTLQTILRKNYPTPFESYYMPLGSDVSSASNFILEPLLSNSSTANQSGVAWTYFTLEIPRGASGGNMHVRLSSDNEINYEIYARFGGLPSHDNWDYFYMSKTNNSDGSMLFMVNNSSKEVVDFYILSASEGTWNFGVKHPGFIDKAFDSETEMSISIERCPNKCSSHGSCSNYMDDSGLAVYSYCSCDRTHGGFDCSVVIVTHEGHMWQSIALIASNAAALLPSYWCLRQRAFPEWVIFTSSGISSALYHACDVGTWCVLSFHVLQFMDFWLSFMAVVSTFVYLAAIDEASRRTINAVVSILTALMAINGATRSSNIVLVIAIGATALVIGLLIELSTKYRSMSLASVSCFNAAHRWYYYLQLNSTMDRKYRKLIEPFCFSVSLSLRQEIMDSVQNGLMKFLKRFRWGFIIAGFVGISLAATSWTLETSQSYWIWHSLWHLSIYTTSFLFLCSKVSSSRTEAQRPSDPQSRNYEHPTPAGEL